MRHRLLGILLALALASGFFVVASVPAAAGSNGQHILYCHSTSRVNWVWTDGSNQYGNEAVDRVDLFYHDPPPTCNSDPAGWWWKGTVRLDWHVGTGGYITTYCNVPVSQSGDYFRCYAPWSY